MAMVFSEHAGQRFSVTAWIDAGRASAFFNLSDSTGEHPIGRAKFRKLPAAVQAAIKSAAAEAVAEERAKVAAAEKSRAEIAKVWRDDMTRYEAGRESFDPWAFAEKTLAGVNYAYAKDCRELPTYQEKQFGKSLTGHCYDTRLSCYYGCLIDGGIVLDISAVLDAKPSLSALSPLLDTHAETVERFADSCRDSWLLDAFAADPANGFSGMARLAQVALRSDLQSFDRVPLSVAVAWWQSRGGRVGCRRGNQIIWQDGATEDIRPECDRWSVGGVVVSA